MLPSWRDEVRIALTPDRVVLARVSRRWRPRITSKHVVHNAVNQPSDWRSSIESLKEALQEPAFRDADACVVLSNHFVRYALVPWSEHLVSDEEKRAWVAHHFTELYGEPDAPAEYRWSDDHPRAACVASAVDAELTAQIRATVEATSLRLRSVQPYLMVAFNRCKKHVNGAPAWLVLPEYRRVCIAAISRGAWRTLTCKSIGQDWESDVALLLERQLLLTEDEPPAVLLAYGADLTRFDVAVPGDARVKVLAPRALPGYSPYTDAEYGIALAGIV